MKGFPGLLILCPMVFLMACSGKPSEEQGRQALEKELDGRQVAVKRFSKTNGVADGANYIIFYSADLEMLSGPVKGAIYFQQGKIQFIRSEKGWIPTKWEVDTAAGKLLQSAQSKPARLLGGSPPARQGRDALERHLDGTATVTRFSKTNGAEEGSRYTMFYSADLKGLIGSVEGKKIVQKGRIHFIRTEKGWIPEVVVVETADY